MTDRRALMIQGTTSDAGKSLFVAALCRIYARRGFSVAPFKPQNMALNSFVTELGGEIGRAQAFQARAAKVIAHTDMNPVLIKPNTDTQAQIIINGKVLDNMDAKSYQDYKQFALSKVLESYQALSKRYDIVFIEGAGSPAEINLRQNDIANMGFAEQINCPVFLIADIDRGGVFAHLIGTLHLLSKHEQELVKGFVINKFRGDIDLLLPGNDWLEKQTNKKVVGTIPYIDQLYVEPEDAIDQLQAGSKEAFRISIIAYPHISNHTDFDPLRVNPNVYIQYVRSPHELKSCDLLILPGSKSVISDLMWLKEMGFDQKIYQHLRYQGRVIGICGGYQMLGHRILDPLHIESDIKSIKGLGLLDMETELCESKQLTNVFGTLFQSADIKGYEIHCGVSYGRALDAPIIDLSGQKEGATSDDSRVIGTYLHGLFEHPSAQKALLHWAGLDLDHIPDYELIIEENLDKIADICEKSCDLEWMDQLLNLR